MVVWLTFSYCLVSYSDPQSQFNPSFFTSVWRERQFSKKKFRSNIKNVSPAHLSQQKHLFKNSPAEYSTALKISDLICLDDTFFLIYCTEVLSLWSKARSLFLPDHFSWFVFFFYGTNGDQWQLQSASNYQSKTVCVPLRAGGGSKRKSRRNNPYAPEVALLTVIQ